MVSRVTLRKGIRLARMKKRHRFNQLAYLWTLVRGFFGPIGLRRRPSHAFLSVPHLFYFSFATYFVFRVIGYFRQEFFIVFKFWLVGVALSVVVSLCVGNARGLFTVPFRNLLESSKCSIMGNSKPFLESTTFVWK